MRQGVVLPETPRERRQLAGLAADVEDSPYAGKPLPVRLRNFRQGADRYLAALSGPLAYMIRLRKIDGLAQAVETALGAARDDLARECDGDRALFAERWRDVVAGWDNKLRAAISHILPSCALAEQHRKMAAPGTAKH